MGIILRRIFISYRRSDPETVSHVNEVVKSLRKDGYNVWQDVTGIKPSTKWARVIEEVLGNSTGAIIFQTSGWEQSAPCVAEYSMIQKMHVPFINVLDKNFTSDENNTPNIKKIEAWIDRILSDDDNNLRQWLYSGAYNLSKNKRNDYKDIIKGRKIRDLKDICSEFREYRTCEINKKLSSDNPELKCFLQEHLKNAERCAKNAILGKVVARVFAVVAVVAVISIYVFSSSFKNVLTAVSDETNRQMCISTIKDNMQCDPVAAMEMICSKELLSEDDDKSINYKIELMSLAADKKYPLHFYKSQTEEARKYSNLVSETFMTDKYFVVFSENGGQVYIHDSATGAERQFLVAAKPEHCSIDSERGLIAVSSFNKVYVYDVYNSIDPIELIYNFENVVQVGFEGNDIYAVTETGNVMVWENPLLQSVDAVTILNCGQITHADNGDVIAVGISGNKLIVNKNGLINSYLISADGEINNNEIEISPDGKYVAVKYVPYQSQISHIQIYDADRGILYKDINTNCDVSGFAFSQDGQSIIYCDCYESRILLEDIDNKDIKTSETIGSHPYDVIRFGDEYIVSDDFSQIRIFDSKLKPKTEWKYNPIQPVIKQMDASGKSNSLFLANRGGLLLGGNAAIKLDSEGYHTLTIPDGLSVISTNCVDVSDDGNFVAFGAANGSILVYDTTALMNVMLSTTIAEQIVDVEISHDLKSIYALGKSGMVYSVDAKNKLVPGLNDKLLSYWNDVKKESYEIQKSMYDMGLSYYAPLEDCSDD